MLLSVEIAQLSAKMENMLEMQPGTKIPANQMTSSKIVLLLDGQKVGYGEVLKIGNTWGIQVTELETSSAHSKE